jgi:hypothetical protein
MAKHVDPTQLVTLAALAAQYQYNPEHLRQVAVAGRLRAWLVSDTVWITTRANFEEYLRSRRPPGPKPRKSRTRRRRTQPSTEK